MRTRRSKVCTFQRSSKYKADIFRYLAAEQKFSNIQVFDQRAEVGGVWNYSPISLEDKHFTVPRTRPTKLPDTAIWMRNTAEAQFVSPVYELLETNIPHTLMNYSDQAFPQGSSLFPKHEAVKQYLEAYAEDIRHMLSLQIQVSNVSRARRGWNITLLDLTSQTKRVETFDAVLVASGHYNDPFIPDIKGLADFAETYPESVSHSKFYRRPDQYAGKKVVVVGNSASGLDLSTQISTVSQVPVLVSEKTAPVTPVVDRTWVKMVPEISEFLTHKRAIRFSNGHVEENIDAVVFCTGYFYSFPFLASLKPSIVTDGAFARHLNEHILYNDDPTLAFLGIPQRVVPFPISEAQAAWVARIWSGRLLPPTHSEMTAWETQRFKEKGEGKAIHNLAFPKDVAYTNMLHERSLSAKKVSTLPSKGVGKIPPYWGADKAWVRGEIPVDQDCISCSG